MPQISVIMSVFSENQEQLKASITSILQQSFSDFEFVIILDNPENTVAKTYIEKQSDPRIVFLENPENIKLGASLNKGINNARGKYIARMDGDDICDITKLEKQYTYMQEHPGTTLLFTWWEEVDEKWKRESRIPSELDFSNIHKTFFYKSPILHASMMCRKEVFEKYQYPETDRPEDFALFMRLIHEGYIFNILEENLYTFFIDSYDLEKKYKKIRIFSWNFLSILWKNKGHFIFNPYFWWMFLVCCIEWILSRNKWIFFWVFNSLQKMYKRFFIKRS